MFFHAKYSNNCIDVIDNKNKTVFISFLLIARTIAADINPNINVFKETSAFQHI
jgi:hypothetical protein